MSYSTTHRAETRSRIVASARRLFNRKGFAEVTIDEIMKQAGLTRGGFYKYFGTKEELYAEAVQAFLCADRPERWQAMHVDLCAEGETLARMIVDAYLSRDHLDDLDGSCPLVALPSDTARGGTAVKAAYRQVLDMMVGVFANALSGPKGRQQALALTSLCVGAMAIARAIDDPALADEFRGAAHDHVLRAQGWATSPRLD